MAGRSVIVCGAASDIGAACARKFGGAGDRLVLADDDEEELRALTEPLRARGDAAFVAGSLTNRLHVHNIIAEALESYGRIDVLVNASMNVEGGNFLDLPEEDFDRLVVGNLHGAFLVNQAVCRQIARQLENAPEERSQGAIVNIISVESVTAAPDRVAFAVSQGGLHQLTKAAALAMSSYGVRVNAVGVGAMRTEQMKERDVKSARKSVPLNRIGDPEDVAEAAFFLASSAASYITGQTLFVDGGRLVRSGADDEERSSRKA